MIISIYESLIKISDDVENTFNDKESFENDIKQYQVQLNQLETQLKLKEINLEKYLEQESEIKQNIKILQKEIEELGIPLLDEKINNKLTNANASTINQYSNYIPYKYNMSLGDEEIQLFMKYTELFLNTFNIVAVTNLSVKASFPLTDELFDIVVIDEASQCDIISAIPLILRTKQLVVIGDKMQLKHISKIRNYEQEYIQDYLEFSSKSERIDYKNQSLYDYCYNLSVNSEIKSVFLKEHYRCHPEIIEYSNKHIYLPLMGQEIEILTKDEDFSIEPKGILWKNIKGKWYEKRTENDKERKQNHKEIEAVIDLATELSQENPNVTIGITSPFRNQIDEIKDRMPVKLKERIKADVVHSFQGQERDIMIFSIAIAQNTPERTTKWVNESSPNLINVAITRAKNTIYVVGDINFCKNLKKGKLYELANYIKEGKII